jgi:hypothetical protein
MLRCDEFDDANSAFWKPAVKGIDRSTAAAWDLVGECCCKLTVDLGLGRILASHHRSSASSQIH